MPDIRRESETIFPPYTKSVYESCVCELATSGNRERKQLGAFLSPSKVLQRREMKQIFFLAHFIFLNLYTLKVLI